MENIFTLEIEVEGIKYEINWHLYSNVMYLYTTDINTNKVLFDKIIVDTMFSTLNERIDYINNRVIPLFLAV